MVTWNKPRNGNVIYQNKKYILCSDTMILKKKLDWLDHDTHSCTYVVMSKNANNF